MNQYKSVRKFCDALSVSYTGVIGLVTLRTSPYLKDLTLSKTAQKIADHFFSEPEDLFPPTLYKVKQNKIIIEVGLQNIDYRCASLITHEAVDEGVKDAVEKVLKTLPLREQIVIQKRYWEEKTYREIGDELEISRSRVQQIEIKAMRRLRHPSRSHQLEVCIR
jgi:RNA polymerase sigma factor (sigma-70 family)